MTTSWSYNEPISVMAGMVATLRGIGHKNITVVLVPHHDGLRVAGLTGLIDPQTDPNRNLTARRHAHAADLAEADELVERLRATITGAVMHTGCTDQVLRTEDHLDTWVALLTAVQPTVVLLPHWSASPTVRALVAVAIANDLTVTDTTGHVLDLRLLDKIITSTHTTKEK